MRFSLRGPRSRPPAVAAQIGGTGWAIRRSRQYYAGLLTDLTCAVSMLRGQQVACRSPILSKLAAERLQESSQDFWRSLGLPRHVHLYRYFVLDRHREELRRVDLELGDG